MQSLKRIYFSLFVIILLAVFGFGNAYFVFTTAKSGGTLPCFVVSGCAQVQSSPYSRLFGVPLSLLGSLYYVGLVFLTIYFLLRVYRVTASNFVQQVLRWWMGYVGFGFLFSLYLTFLQIFVIQALCSSCLLSFLDSLIITTIALILWRRTLPQSTKTM